MTEYIDKLVILNQISELKSFYEKERKQSGDCLQEMNCVGAENGLTTLEDIISDIPTADVAPVVHGRWDNIPKRYMSVVSKDGSYHGNVTSCSACHEVNPNAYKTNYCPNCGASWIRRNKLCFIWSI